MPGTVFRRPGDLLATLMPLVPVINTCRPVMPGEASSAVRGGPPREPGVSLGRLDLHSATPHFYPVGGTERLQ